MVYYWKYKGELYESMSKIKKKFSFGTVTFKAKLRDGEIIKLNEKNQDHSYEDIYVNKE